MSRPKPKPKLSQEQIQTKRRKLLDEAENITMQISQVSHLLEKNEEEFTRFMGFVANLHDAFYGFKNYDVPANDVEEHQSNFILEVIYKSGTHKVVCNVVKSRLSTGKYVTQAEDATMTASVSHMRKLVGALVNYSCKTNVIDDMAKESDFLTVLVRTLEAGHEAHLNGQLSEMQNQILSCCMRILSNCALVEKNIPRLRDIRTVDVLFPYLGSNDDSIKVISLAALAKLVNEDEAKNLITNHDAIFTLLIQRLNKALQSSEHREDWGKSVKGLTKTLREVARNDNNKKVLVDRGCLSPLVSILDSSHRYEVAESLMALWVLSFDEDNNKQKMVEEKNLVKLVWEKYSHDSGDIKKSSYGILWSLKEQLKMGKVKHYGIAYKIEDEFKKANMKPAQGDAQTKKSGHVMLSYNWGHQETILQICQKLKDDGVPVWIDVELMEGSMLETMANAVENCSIFIMAMSRPYKDSPNCRLEAEYAQTRNKTIIPLLMEKGYKPDGWLGIIKGYKLHYDFSENCTFDVTMENFLKAVKNQMGKDTPTDSNPSATRNAQGQSDETERQEEVSTLSSQSDERKQQGEAIQWSAICQIS